MKRKLLFTFLTIMAISSAAQEKKSFAAPPDENRPWIFWDWMNDLVTKKGITSDLESFQKFGLRGTLVMLIGSETGSYPMWDKHNMPNPVVSQTPEFFNMWKYAAEESARLGLTITTQLGPGWCHSGGPWVKPEQSVQHLVYTETETIKGPLKQAKVQFTNNSQILGTAYHSERPAKDTPHWVQIKLPRTADIDQVVLHPFNHGQMTAFGFPLQFIVEVATKSDFSDRKTFYKTTADIPAPQTKPLVITGKAHGQYIRLTATKNYAYKGSSSPQYILSLLEMEVKEKGLNLAANAPATASSTIENYGYSLKALTDNSDTFSSKTANNTYMLNQPGAQYFTSDVSLLAFPDKEVIKPEEVIDLSKYLKNGQAVWDVPAGDWKIRRYAIRNALAYNRPAPIGGKGLECDKLDKDAVDAMFEGMVGRYLKDSPQLVGKTIRAFEADSWEVGNPEWSPKFKQEFIKRRGYDPTPWMITYKTSRKVGSEDLTKRFLNDMYLTQTDLFADNFFSHLAGKAEKLGMEFVTEAYFGPFDPIRTAGRAQVPMGEFWASGDFLNSVRWASSSAHTYNKKTVAAEAFTGRWNDGTWTMDPYGIKRVGDLAFCNGVNKMILHGTALQPWGKDVKPGMPMFFWGTMFSPGQTWIEPGKAWVDYISRCEYMLTEGKNVADVAGLMPTLDWVNAMPSGLHKQYNYDLLSEEIFLHDMEWKDGYFILPSGARYRILFLPKTNGKMDASILSKLISLAKQGGVIVCQDKPETAPGLSNYPQCDEEVKKLVDVLWGACDGKTVLENKVDKGRLVWMDQVWEDRQDVENTYFNKTRAKGWAFYGQPASTTHWSPAFSALLKSITPPDVEVVKAAGKAMAWGGFEQTAAGNKSGEDAIAWVHHRNGNMDTYFVSSQVATPNNAEILFRVKDKVPELWCAETGRVYRPEKWAQEGERIRMTIPFTEMGSVFVVFKPAAEMQAGLPVYNKTRSFKASVPLDGQWQVSFPRGYGAPAKAIMTAGDWTSNIDPGIKYFSGTAMYQTSVTLSKEQLGTEVVLDLGQVRNLAEVVVNGVSAGVLWKPPFVTDITSLLKPGANTLIVKVTNTWWNRMVGDEQLPEDLKWGAKVPYHGVDNKGYPLKEIPEWVWSGEERPSKDRVTFSTWKFVEKDSPLEKSGLIGPVQLKMGAK